LKKCNQYIQDINDYIDGEIDESLCSELEQHLKECSNCRIMVDSLRQTVVLCRGGKREALPEKLEIKLTNALRERWEKKFKK